MNVRTFLFDSAYQIITWVVIAVSIGGIYHFASKSNWRGTLWSLVLLLTSVIVMLGLLADRYIVEAQIRRSVKEAKEQPRVVPSDRPWLSVDIQATGPLSFDSNGTTLPLRYIITNAGHSPANKVVVRAEIFFPKFGGGDFLRDPVNRQKEVCAQSMSFPFGGTTVFPSRTVVIPISYGMNMDAMRDQFATEQMKKDGSAGKIAAPYLVGCVTYNFGDLFTGETGFIWQIQRRRENLNMTLNLIIGEDVPIDQLVFVNFAFGGDYAR